MKDRKRVKEGKCETDGGSKRKNNERKKEISEDDGSFHYFPKG